MLRGSIEGLWLVFSLCVLMACQSDDLTKDRQMSGPGPLKVFILAGQSNMVGTGVVEPTQAHLDKNGGMGTLRYLVNDAVKGKIYEHLVKVNGQWVTRDDVWLVDLNHSGPLAIGKTFGPELQFGHVMGDHYSSPILIIKIAWGGKSLYKDFRPPSSGKAVGPYYTAMVDRVEYVLNNLNVFLPWYDGRGYDLVGFGWHQGWNDRVDQVANNEYQTNLVNFINDIRKDLGKPSLRFVIATTGMCGWNEEHPRALSLMHAQLNAPNDLGLKYKGNVEAIDTRDFWRDAEWSPSNQGYHWNRNAETYFLIGDCMAKTMLADTKIDAVFFAQTHVLRPKDPYFGLVSDKPMLLKAHVVSPSGAKAPKVNAVFALENSVMVTPLMGPALLPKRIDITPGIVQHSLANSFWAYIPGRWIKPGLNVTVKTEDSAAVFDRLKVSPPSKVIMTMFDVHYFAFSQGDYPKGWLKELEAKWPTSEIELRRVPNIVFSELTIPPRANLIAARIKSKADYAFLTGKQFDGEQAAALKWVSALKAAAGTSGRYSLYYVNIHGVNSGGQAGGFSGVGNGRGWGILHHELGHALSLPHWCDNVSYPYRGAMYGIPAPDSIVHVGPTWAYDLPTRTFIPPTVQSYSVGGTAGTYKKDPMCGGGAGDQEKQFMFRHFSDYSVRQMREYLERHIVVWNEALKSYASWDAAAQAYTKKVSNNGVQFPMKRDVWVISVMAGVSAVTPQSNIVYRPIGPYKAGLIDTFDPTRAEDRSRADDVFCPNKGCDVSLRIIQGGKELCLMLPIALDATANPFSGGSHLAKAVNLPASDGAVTKAELILTPDAEKQGIQYNPKVLATWVK